MYIHSVFFIWRSEETYNNGSGQCGLIWKAQGKHVHGNTYTYMNTWKRKNVGAGCEASLLVHGPSISPVPVHEVGGESHVGPKRGILTVTPRLSLRPWVTPLHSVLCNKKMYPKGETRHLWLQPQICMRGCQWFGGKWQPLHCNSEIVTKKMISLKLYKIDPWPLWWSLYRSKWN
jgi:hypothetical protein